MAGTTATQIASNLAALGFDNPSAAALYNKIAQAVGDTVDATITEMTNSENSILNIITSQRYGTAGYYTAAALAFQLGYNLSPNPVTLAPQYSVIDPAAQIISQAAFEQIVEGSSAQLFLKVATLNAVTGLLGALTAPKYAAFAAYFLNFELPGIPVTIVSSPADVLNFTAVCTFYSTYDQSTLQTAVQNAMAAFMTSFPFNGEFFNGDLADYIKQNVPGMRDFYITGTSLNGNGFNGSIPLPAGYFNYSTNIFNQIAYQAIYGS